MKRLSMVYIWNGLEHYRILIDIEIKWKREYVVKHIDRRCKIIEEIFVCILLQIVEIENKENNNL